MISKSPGSQTISSLGAPQWDRRDALSFRNSERCRPIHGQCLLFPLRLCVHPDLLSLPKPYHAQQVLCKLPDLRLGGFYDVYPHGLYPAFFQLDPVLDVGARTDQMGFNKNQRKSLQKCPRGRFRHKKRMLKLGSVRFVFDFVRNR